MIRAKNYEKLSKFVKVTAKILLVPVFPDTLYILSLVTVHYTVKSEHVNIKT